MRLRKIDSVAAGSSCAGAAQAATIEAAAQRRATREARGGGGEKMGQTVQSAAVRVGRSGKNATLPPQRHVGGGDAPPIVLSWNSWNWSFTKRITKLDFPTAVSPNSTSLNVYVSGPSISVQSWNAGSAVRA